MRYRNFLSIVIFGVLTATGLYAQGTGVMPALILRQPGEGFGVLLQPPTGGTSQPTFTFPSTSGTLLVSASGVTPTFGSLQLSGASNQLVLGAGPTTTINAVAPAASSIYTIPDVGTAASFVMTEGAQTVNGNKTLSGTTNLSGLTASRPLKLDASKNIVSSQIDLASTNDITGTLGITNGGTNITTYATGDVLYASAANTLSKLAIGTSGQVLRVSAGGVPEWTSVAATSFGSLTTGTNSAATMTVDNGASILLGTSGAIIEANRFKAGGSTDAVDLASAEVAGTLPVANGGTGATSLTANGIVLGNGTSPLSTTAVGATGTVLIGNTGSAPTFSSAPTVTSATLSSATNQLVLGTTNTTTINAVAPAASSVYTIPDVGTAASFVMTEGAQTVNGNKTLSGTTNLSALTASRPLKLDASKNIVSSQIDLASTNDVTGTLPVVGGGTGIASYTVGDLLYASTATTLSTVALGSTDDLLTISGGVPTWVSRASIASGTSWIPGGNTTGITGTNNIIGINYASGQPLRFFVDGGEAFRIAPTQFTVNTATTRLAGTASTGLVIVGGATQGTGNYVDVQTSAADNVMRLNVAGSSATLRLGSTTNPASLEIAGGLAVSSITTSATSNRIYALPTIESSGDFVIADGQGAAGQILVSNGSGNRAGWTSTFPTGLNVPFNQIATGDNATATMTVSNGASIILNSTGAGIIEANRYKGVTGMGTTDAVDLATAEVSGTLPVANGGTGLATTPTNGQILIGNGTNYSLATITGTTNQVAVSNGAGTITLSTPQNLHAAATPTFASMTLSATSNQLTLGTTTTTTIDAFAPVANRTYTIPDAGANALFVLSEGTKTINGSTTLAGTVNLSGLTASRPLKLDASRNIVSSQIDLASTNDITGTLGIANGGTNITTYATGDILYASAANTLSKLAIGTSGQVLRVSAGGVPEWTSSAATSFGSLTTGTNSAATMTVDNGASILLGTSGAIIEANRFKAGGSTDAVDLASAEVAGTLPVANGGTGATTLTANGVLIGNGTSAVTALTTANNAMLVTNGTGVPSISTTFPSGVNVPFSQITGTIVASQFVGTGSLTNAVDLATAEVAGTLPVANGGTGATSLTANGVLIGNGTSAVTALTTANNAMLVTDGTGVPSISTTFPSGVNVPASQITGTIVASQFVGSGSTTNAVDLATAEVAGTLPVANGGTGATTLTANGVLIGNGTSAVTALTTANNAMLVTNGTGVPSISTTFPSGVNVPFSQITGTIVASQFVGTGSTTNAVDLATAEVSGTLPVANGGTGATSLTADRLLLGNGTSAISTLATANNAMLVTNGTGVPSISTTFPSGVNVPASQITGTIVASQFVGSGSTTNVVDLATAEVAGTLPVANGGTGATTLTANGVLIGNGTSAVTALTTANNAMLVTNGTGVPSISTTFPSGVNVPASQITGTLPIANGGTNITTYTTGDILYASAANTLSTLPIGTSGQVLRVSAGGVPEWATGSSAAFSGITTGTNTSATMTVGTGASILLTGTGIVEANRFKAGGSTDAVDLATAEVAGTLPVANGGTGATDAATARTNLGAQAADGDLTAVAGLTTTGIVVRTNTDAMTTRTIAATSPISITNGDGVAGNPSITLGTVPVGNGGTGATTLTANGVLLGNGTSAVSATAVGATGQVLIGNTGAAPSWSGTPTVSSMTLTNTTNQIVLGTTNTTTLSAVAPAASRTYTIPDVGADANFVMTQGTQTVNGSKTFVDNVVLGTGTAAGQIRFREGSADGTQFTSFQAGAQTADIQYTLPTVAPTGGQVLRANTTTPTNLEWGTAAGTTTVFVRRTTAQADGGGLTTGLTFTLTANKVYTFTARLIMTRTTNTGLEIAFTNGTGTIASGSYAFTRMADAVAAASGGYAAAIATAEQIGVSAAGATNHYVLNGILVMGATGGTVTLDFNRTAPAAGVATMEAGSYIHFTEVE